MVVIDASVEDATATVADATATVDAGPHVICSAAEPALTTMPANAYLEPSMYVDNLTLVARSVPGPSVFEAVRPNLTSPFGNFEAVTVIQSEIQDQTFLDVETLGLGMTVLGMGASGTPRQLLTCADPPSVACVPAAVFDDLGAAIEDDLDGPTLANRDGQLVLAFSRGDAIYLAQPRATLAEWDAVLFDLGIEGALADDPAFTVDGRLLIVAMTVGATSGLFAYLWDPANQTYGDPQLFATALGAPAIGVETATTIEIFGHGDSRGVSEPHRLSCTKP